MGREVAVAETEPRGCAVAVERVHGGERLARKTPAGLGVLGTGQRVGDRVEVGAHQQPVEPVVVAGVHDDGEISGRDDLDEATEEARGPDPARQCRDHAL